MTADSSADAELAPEPVHEQAAERSPPPRQEIVPHFAPVPRLKERSNGWSPEVQREFIEALAETGSVRSACRAVGRADNGAYMLRRHPEAEEFRRAWDAALDIGIRRIEDVAMDRAINGVEQPLHYHGEVFGQRTVYNDRLLMFMLRNRAPDRFGGGLRKHGAAGGDNAIDRMELNRLKKRWRKQWEREEAERSAARSQEVGETFCDLVDARHLRWWANLGPRAREAYLQFRRIESEETHALGYDDEAWDDDRIDAALADYEETYPDDGRAKIDRLIEADGPADAAIFGAEPYTPPPGRMISLTDDGWLGGANRIPDDGRATEWP